MGNGIFFKLEERNRTPHVWATLKRCFVRNGAGTGGGNKRRAGVLLLFLFLKSLFIL